jgi:hypothetical protein
MLVGALPLRGAGMCIRGTYFLSSSFDVNGTTISASSLRVLLTVTIQGAEKIVICLSGFEESSQLAPPCSGRSFSTAEIPISFAICGRKYEKA